MTFAGADRYSWPRRCYDGTRRRNNIVEPRALLVLTTCPSGRAAERLAATLVERRLAACVNCIDGVRSVYRWQGALERGNETLLLIKTTRERFAAVAAEIESASNYELPEVIAVPVERGSAEYLSWIAAGVADSEEHR